MHFHVLGSRDQMPFSIRSSLSVRIWLVLVHYFSVDLLFLCSFHSFSIALHLVVGLPHPLVLSLCSCPVLPLQPQAFAFPILPIYSSMWREVILPIRNEPAPPAPGTFAYRRLRRFQFWRIWRELRIAILAQGVWQDHHLRSFCDAALARVQDSLLDADHFCVLLSRCVR